MGAAQSSDGGSQPGTTAKAAAAMPPIQLSLQLLRICSRPPSSKGKGKGHCLQLPPPQFPPYGFRPKLQRRLCPPCPCQAEYGHGARPEYRQGRVWACQDRVWAARAEYGPARAEYGLPGPSMGLPGPSMGMPGPTVGMPGPSTGVTPGPADALRLGGRRTGRSGSASMRTAQKLVCSHRQKGRPLFRFWFLCRRG